MKLFLIHCGFYDKRVSQGSYESHVNLFVAAEDFDQARARAKELPEFKELNMHIDGMQRIDSVSGHEIIMKRRPALANKTVIVQHRKRGHPPKEIIS